MARPQHPICSSLTIGDVVPRLVAQAASLSGRPLPFEDAFVTGILAEETGVERVVHPGFTHLRRRKDPCAYEKAITGHRMPLEEILWLWNETEKLIRFVGHGN